MKRNHPELAEFPALPATIVAEWLQPFLDYLEKERRYSAYTVRNYRQAFGDFYCWWQQGKEAAADFTTLTARDTRDFIVPTGTPNTWDASS